MYTKSVPPPSFHSCVSRAFCQSTGYGGTIKEGHDVDKVTCAQYQWSQGAPQGPDHGEEGGEASHHQVHRGHRRPDEVIQVCHLDVMEKWGYMHETLVKLVIFGKTASEN